MLQLKILIHLTEALKWVQLGLIVLIGYITDSNIGIILGTVILIQVVLTLIMRDTIVSINAAYAEQLKGEKKL